MNTAYKGEPMKLLLTCLLTYLLVGIGSLMAYPTTPSGDAIREWEPNRDYTIDTVVWEKTTDDFYRSNVPAHTSSPTFAFDIVNWVEMSDDLNRLLDGQGVHNAVAVWTSTSGDDIRTTSVFIDELDNMFGIQELSVTGNTLIGGSLFLTGTANIEGALNLTGDAAILGNVTMAQTLVVGGTTNIGGSTTISGTADISGNVTMDGFLNMSHQTTPATPTVGTDNLYFKADHKLYRHDELNVEKLVGLEFGSVNDNRLIKSDGTGGDAIQESNILVNDDDSLFDISHLSLLHIATPATPTVGSDKLYFKADDKLYKLDTAGVEKLVGLENTSTNDSRLMVSDGTTAEAIRESSVTVNADAISGVSTLSMSGDLDVDGQAIIDGGFNSLDIATPLTPTTGRTTLYTKADGKLYKLNDIDGEEVLGLALSSTSDNRLIVSDGTSGDSLEETSITVDPISGDLTTTASIYVGGKAHFDLPLDMLELASALTPSAGNSSLYFKTDGGLYKKDSSGAESIIGAEVRAVVIRDEKTAGSDGGTCTSGSYITRDLNTIEGASFASISTNQISISAGTYQINVRAATYQLAKNKLKLRNVSDSVDLLIGFSTYGYPAGEGATPATLLGEFTITSTKNLEIVHACSNTKATNGFGLNSSLYGDTEIFLEAWIFKIN